MRLITAMIAGAGMFLTVPASAQAGMTAGMKVTDASGALVGTVKAVQGTNLLIQTDKHEVLLPSTSFTASDGKLLFGMTQAQLDAEIEKNLSAASAAIVPGAKVKGAGGSDIGAIEAVADGKATIALQNGKKIAVPQEGLRGNADGTVTIGYTSEQLDALVAGAGSAGN